MAPPWKSLDKVQTPDGMLELRRRGEREFLITLDRAILMNSMANRSEAVLGTAACAGLGGEPRVLVAGLGMGITLRAVLDALPPKAQVVVAELNPVVLEWCKGPLAPLTQGAVSDPRVSTRVIDVAALIREAGARKYDAIVLDLYTGPDARSHERDDPFYGSRAIGEQRAALTAKGVLAVWGEAPERSYEQRLTRAGFTVRTDRPGRGGLRHVIYVARRTGAR